MKGREGGPAARLCLICYPYYPSQDTGRGHDRYAFELRQNISGVSRDMDPYLLHQGFSRGVLAAGLKYLKFIVDLLL